MTQETKPRSWRDLPPEPPFGDVPEPPPRPATPAPPPPATLALESAPPPRRRRWAVLWVPLLVLAILAAIAGGVWAFTRDGGDEPEAAGPPPDLPRGFSQDDTPAVPFDADPPSDFEELFPPDYLDRFGRNFFDEFAPDLEIPDELLDQFPRFFFEEFGRDFFGEDGPGFGFGPGEDFESLLPPDGFGEQLRRFFEGLEEGDFRGLFDALPPELRDQLPGDMPERFSELFPGFEPGELPEISGVAPTYLPDGFQVISASMRSDGRDLQVELSLVGPGGPIEVIVLGGSVGETAFRTADGEPADVAGVEGREEVAGGERKFTYRKDDVTVIITAPEGFDRDELLAVADGLETGR